MFSLISAAPSWPAFGPETCLHLFGNSQPSGISYSSLIISLFSRRQALITVLSDWISYYTRDLGDYSLTWGRRRPQMRFHARPNQGDLHQPPHHRYGRYEGQLSTRFTRDGQPQYDCRTSSTVVPRPRSIP